MNKLSGLMAALSDPQVGLAEAGFAPAGRAVLERQVSEQISWRVVVLRDSDESRWQGEVRAGVLVPPLCSLLSYQEPLWREPGVYSRNVLELAGRNRDPNARYDGDRMGRGGLFGGRRPDEEVLARVSRDLGVLVRDHVLPWFAGLTSLADVANEMDAWLTSLPQGKAPLDWAELGALWHVAGQPDAAARAWDIAKKSGREPLRYVQRLKAGLGAA